jgi:hypothetical protein
MMSHSGYEYFALGADTTTGTCYNRIAGWVFDYQQISKRVGASDYAAVSMNAANVTDGWRHHNIGFYVGGDSAGRPFDLHFGNVENVSGGILQGTYGTAYGLQMAYYSGGNRYRAFEFSVDTAGNTLVNQIAGWNFDVAYLWTGTQQTSDTYSSSGITIAAAGAIRAKELYCANEYVWQ